MAERAAPVGLPVKRVDNGLFPASKLSLKCHVSLDLEAVGLWAETVESLLYVQLAGSILCMILIVRFLQRTQMITYRL